MRLFVLVLLGLVICPFTGAAEVVLRDGTVLEGRVSVRGGEVSISSGTGTVTLPMRRVVAIQREEPAVATRPAHEDAGAEAAEDAPPREGGDGAPTLAEALNRPLDVNLTDATAFEFLQLLRDETGINLAVTQAVRESDRPVSLQVEGVRALVLLRLVLEQTGFHAASRPDEVLFVSHKPLDRRVRSYRVRDLLVDWGDAGGGDDDEEDEDDDDWEDDDEGNGRDARADELRELVENICGRQSIYFRGRLFVLPEGAAAPDRREQEELPFP
jgi:hypothetical protein